MSTKKQLTIVRPANATPYAAGDVINNNGSTAMLELDLSGPSRLVLGGQIISSKPSGAPKLTAWFFSDSNAVPADNAAFDLTDTQTKESYLGRVIFAADDWSASSSNKTCDGSPKRPFSVPGDKIYVVLTADEAYTPDSSEEFTLQFDTVI